MKVLTLIAVYFDDIIVCSDSETHLQGAKNDMMKSLDLKILGKIKYILGVEYVEDEKYIMLKHTLYIDKLASLFLLKNNESNATHDKGLIV
jgi:Reverse transcriptase (RNA-dependent DNA polymerase)